jgi:Tol biopolymer transport system component/DNA-binding winged helix-turn-helix (wHTH) protein
MPQNFEFGSFSLDLAEHQLRRDGQPVPLTPRVFDLLRVLVENAGHLIEKERLLTEVWSDAFVEEANLNRAISVLRKTLGESPTQRYIETVPKRGYRFVGPVTVNSTDPTPATGGPVERQSHAPASIVRTTRAVSVAALTMAAIVAIVALVAVNVLFRRDGGSAGVNAAESPMYRQLTFTGKEMTPALSPDGTRVAYVSKESPQRKVKIHDITSGREIEVFSAPEIGALRWSPDGSELMFFARGHGGAAQYIAPVSGGSARKIAAGFFVGCWSPDGSTIALGLFVTGKVLFLNRVGDVQRTIALKGTSGDWMSDLDWSRVHGRLLIVADDERRVPSIWTIRSDGSEQAKVFSGESEILAARWASTGDAIYYFSRAGQTISLHKVFVDPERQVAAGKPIPIVNGLESDEGFGISADGKRLVYAKAPYYSNLWLMDVGHSVAGRPSQPTPLTHGTAVIERPRVSPDGSTIVFNMGYESRANLYTIPAAGGTPKQLTFFNAFSVDGAWSPDGQSVAFASTEGGVAGVWVVNANGSSPRPLSNGDMSDVFDITWAPGDRVLYQRAGNRDFFVVDPQTRQKRLLISDSSVGYAASAEYSPDGKTIAVSWNRRPARGLWLLDTDSSRETLVSATHNPTEPIPFPIGWSRDGRYVIAVNGKRAAYRGLTAAFEETITEATILRVAVEDGRTETLLSLPFDEVGSVAMFPDGRRFVATVYSSRSDVWVIDNFDGTAAPAIAATTK